MKKMKNIVAAMSLMAVLGLGATAANAGMLMSDFSGSNQPSCATNSNSDIISQATGIIIVGLGGASSVTGILIGDFAPTCAQPPASNTGIIIVG